jgi:hypothetical protein
MTAQEREHLARATNRLIRASTSSQASDPEKLRAELMQKLRTALDSLEALGISSTAANVAGQKRIREGEGLDEEEDAAATDRKNAAIAAIDAAELNLKTSKQSINRSKTLGMGGDSRLSQSQVVIAEATEMAADLFNTKVHADTGTVLSRIPYIPYTLYLSHTIPLLYFPSIPYTSHLPYYTSIRISPTCRLAYD